ncbi:MAG TPA: alpha-glucuronidase family glycosyl hydrolase, partial [Opitutaceae bacterium]
MLRRLLLSFALLSLFVVSAARAEDGYRLWLRYDLIDDAPARADYAAALQQVVLATPSGAESPTIAAARDELTQGLRGLLGSDVQVGLEKLTGTPPASGNADGYALRALERDGRRVVTIAGSRDLGVLYGVFDLLRRIQTRQPLAGLDVASVPKIQRRILNHWDNLNRFVERVYSGSSLWEWFELPDYRTPRYRDYARANASIGINGTVLTNVNADALVLTRPYLEKVAALADEFRPYGIRVYLTARFSAPIEIGGLKTADPLDPAVAAWWRAKVDEIYGLVPDFGGFLVKANSEGQPGPQNYGRNHADGANMMADALAPHGGIVMWRAFVYEAHAGEDRVKQAYSEFKPLDGKFRANVVVQIKNGALDFMPREPFHPLFGAMPRTPLGMEFQITQEYLGGSVHLAFLAPMWEEVLDADTFTAGPGSTVARVIDGSLDQHAESVIAGVANIGTDRNWTGHPLAQANWYAYGRLAWDHALGSEQIAREWTRLTFGNDARVAKALVPMLLASRETVVDYSMPLGLHHIMAQGHHYGPGPWVDQGRPDWTSVHYHQAAADGIGFNRSSSGTNAVEQYAPEVARRFDSLETCPEEFLLWFHHLPWDHRLRSGRTLWDELGRHYQRGVDAVRGWQRTWDGLAGQIDGERFAHVKMLLARQEREARQWRDACLQYFQQFSKRPLPSGVEPPEHPLEYYKAIQLRYVPGDPSGK